MSYKLNYVNKRRIANLGKKTIIAVLVAVTVFFTASGIIHGMNENKLENVINNYISYSEIIDDFANTTNDEFQKKINSDYSSVGELLGYVEISEKLHDLNLEQYNLDKANISELFAKEDIELLIQKFEDLKSTNKVISNEAYNLNAVVATLKAQELLVNEKVYYGYNSLGDLALDLTKLMVSKETGVDPANIRIVDFYSSASSGQASCKAVITKNGKEEYYVISNSSNRELMTVAALAFASQTQMSKTVTEDEKTAYNENRNEFMKDGVKSINDLFKEYLKDYSHGTIKSSIL